MSASWEGLHDALRQSAKTAQSVRQFRIARTADPVLARFDSPTELIEYLETNHAHEPAVLDDKDQIYAALVRGVQARAEWAELAHTILCCGLRPGLDKWVRLRSKALGSAGKKVAASLPSELILLVGRIDLARVHRVAATLKRSTVRNAMDERRRALLEVELRQSLARQPNAERWADPRSIVGMSFESEREALRAKLLLNLADDTDLLLAVLVDGENGREAAQRLGIAYDAARKRFKRALPLAKDFLVHLFPLMDS